MIPIDPQRGFLEIIAKFPKLEDLHGIQLLHKGNDDWNDRIITLLCQASSSLRRIGSWSDDTLTNDQLWHRGHYRCHYVRILDTSRGPGDCSWEVAVQNYDTW